jgi:hypothetical protein
LRRENVGGRQKVMIAIYGHIREIAWTEHKYHQFVRVNPWLFRLSPSFTLLTANQAIR